MKGICLHHLFLVAKLAAVGVALIRHLVTIACAISLIVFDLSTYLSCFFCFSL